MTDKEKEKLLKKFDKFLDFMQDIEWSDAFLIGNYGWSSDWEDDVDIVGYIRRSVKKQGYFSTLREYMKDCNKLYEYIKLKIGKNICMY